MDCSLPGSSAHGIFQARVLEWRAIAFSMEYKSVVSNYYYSVQISEASLILEEPHDAFLSLC